MKKIIALLLVLTLGLGLFAGCTPAETTTAGPTLAEAVDFLATSYSGDEGNSTPADYKLVSRVLVRGVAFEVTWTASLNTIKITKTEDGKYWVVDVPSKNETETEYTLTATVKDAAGKTETRTFKRNLPVYDDSAAVTELVEGQAYKMFLIQANLGKTLFATTATQKDNGQDKYIKTDIDPKKGADFFAEKVEGGYKFYTMIDGVKNYVHAYLVADGTKASKHIGFATETDCVYYYKADVKAWHVKLSNEELEYKDVEYVVGTYNTFDTICISEGTYITAENTGVSQFAIAFVTKEAGEAMTPTEGPADPTELTSITDFTAFAEALENKTSTVEKYLVEGVIVEIKNTTYGNMYIQDEAGNKLYIYGVHSKDGETRFDAMDPQPKVGDTVTLMGIAKNYDGAQMENGWVQELIPGEGGGNEGGDETVLVPELVTNPEIGKAYKMGLFSTEKNATYFFTGVMSGYYGATSTTMADGIDVSLEDAGNGAYYITFTVDGAKKYIGTAINGDHLNFVIVDEADRATFTWNADNKTFYTMMGEKETFMGTSGKHVTFGMMTTDKVANSYAAHLYIGVPGEAGGNESGETEEVFTAVTGKLNVVKGEDKYYAIALDGSWVTATTTEAEAADVVIEFNADYTKAKIKAGGKYIAPAASNKVEEGEYIWTVEKTAEGAYKFLGQQGDNAVALALNGSNGKFRAYKITTIEGQPESYPCEFTFTTK